MSSFDTVIVSCVDCDKLNTIQSKAGECSMVKHNQTFVPIAIGADLLGTEFECVHCKFINSIGSTHATHISIFAYELESNVNDKNDKKVA